MEPSPCTSDAVCRAALAQAAEVTSSGFLAVDTAGRVLTWNRGAERITGLASADVVDRPLLDVAPGDARVTVGTACMQVAEERATAVVETAWTRPDGALLHVRLTVAPVELDAAPAGTSIVVHDVTTERATELRLRESEERSRLIVELAHDAYVGMDDAGLVIGWNRAAERLFGFSREEAVGCRMSDLIVPERLRAGHEGGRRRFLATEHSRLADRPLELAAVDRAGVEFPIELTLSPVRVGDRWAFNAFIRDLRARDEAAADQARLAALVESSDDAIYSRDAQGRITSWNPGAERLFGHRAEDVIGRDVALLIPPHRDGEGERILRSVLGDGRPVVLETERLHRDGHGLDVSVTVSAIRDREGTPVGASVIAREVGERLRRARRDDVTGLPTRQVLAEQLDMQLEAVAEEGAGSEVALALVDVDRFHELNDALGRWGGDRVLVELTRTLQRALPPRTVLARVGADQFAALLAAPGAAALLTNILQGAVPAVVGLDDLTLHVDASTGLSCGPDDGQHGDDLLAAAEGALREAKRRRSGFERFDARRPETWVPSVTVASELRRALEREELVLHFQPQVDLATGAVAGAEGLIRWQHPTRGLLAPGAFLPSVERSSLMRELTFDALSQGLRQAHRWHAAGHAIPVSINLSVLNLLDLGIAHDVARLLAEHRVAPSLLRLEITEDSLMVDPERAAGVLAGLQAMGVELAIDDFGTGYSSLAYLQRLPVRELKIDRCFVRDLASNRSDAAIVRSTIDMARNLGLRVVAEGVEDAASLDALRVLGCDLAQGFHLGRPMPAAELTALLRAAAG